MTKYLARGAVLLCLWRCTDPAVIGYNCPVDGCDAGTSDPCAAAALPLGEVCCHNDADCMLDDDKTRCHPEQHRCVECMKDSQCDVNEPFCVEHACAKCRDAADCASQTQCDGQCEQHDGR